MVEYLSLLLIYCDQLASHAYQGFKSTMYYFSFANGKLQSVCRCYTVSLCKRTTMRGLPHQRCSNPGSLLCCFTPDENRAKRWGSRASTETKGTHSYWRNIHTDKVFKQIMILAQLVDFSPTMLLSAVICHWALGSHPEGKKEVFCHCSLSPGQSASLSTWAVV